MRMHVVRSTSFSHFGFAFSSPLISDARPPQPCTRAPAPVRPRTTACEVPRTSVSALKRSAALGPGRVCLPGTPKLRDTRESRRAGRCVHTWQCRVWVWRRGAMCMSMKFTRRMLVCQRSTRRVQCTLLSRDGGFRHGINLRHNSARTAPHGQHMHRSCACGGSPRAQPTHTDATKRLTHPEWPASRQN